MNVHGTKGSSSAEPRWHKSSHSGAEGGQCLEVAASRGAVHVRDSKQRTGPTLRLSAQAWAPFVAAAAHG